MVVFVGGVDYIVVVMCEVRLIFVFLVGFEFVVFCFGGRCFIF